MEIKSNRLILRDLETEDIDIFFEYRSDHDLCKFQDFMVSTKEESIAFIESQKKVSIGQKGEWKQIAITLHDNTLIGDCAIQFKPEEPRIAEIGCTIRSEFHNQGLATEAIRVLIDHVFKNHPLHKIIAVVDIRNIPSQKIIKKLGFLKEGLLRKHYWDKASSQWFDEVHYGLLKEDILPA